MKFILNKYIEQIAVDVGRRFTGNVDRNKSDWFQFAHINSFMVKLKVLNHNNGWKH